MSITNPFTDPTLIPGLYASEERLARRTDALHRAKISGSRAAEAIADLAATLTSHGPGQVFADIGCGRGATTHALAQRLPEAQILAVDAASAMLQATRLRLHSQHARIRLIQADFHHLPFHDRTCQLAVAAFCLYHSEQPASAIAEISRCLTPQGIAILVTKSVNSYRELDRLVASSGLDPDAQKRPSLYKTAHSANLLELAARSLNVEEVIHEEHVFQFHDHHHLANYLATVPKYRLPAPMRDDPLALATELRGHTDGEDLTATSTVTYVVARRTAHA